MQDQTLGSAHRKKLLFPPKKLPHKNALFLAFHRYKAYVKTRPGIFFSPTSYVATQIANKTYMFEVDKCRLNDGMKPYSSLQLYII